MERFIGRTRELAELTRELDEVRRSGRGRFVWLHGRRRVGKSRLVQEFCDRSGVPYCYFQAPRRGPEAALADFAAAVASSDLPDSALFAGTTFAGWDAALVAATRSATTERPVVLVVDELPYLTENDDGFAADLQRAWDRTLERLPVLLVCIGSDVRMMEELVRERSPLHGRPTRQLRVAPLDPAAVGALSRTGAAVDVLERYLVVGGLPALAASWAGHVARRAFLEDALRDDQTPLVVQAVWLLDGELRGAGKVRDVLESIGAGETAFNRIVARSGASQRTVMQALETLIDHKGLVARRSPYAIPVGQKSARYVVADPYLRFWLRFVGPHLAEIARGRGDLVVDRIEREWTTYCGRGIEPIVRDAIERLGTAPEWSAVLGGARHVEGWWLRDNSVEVDLVGGDAPQPSSLAFVGSVKWRAREPFGADDVRALEVARSRVPGAAGARLVGVSRSGYKDGLGLDAQLGPEDLLAAWT